MSKEYPDKTLHQLFTTHWKHIQDLEEEIVSLKIERVYLGHRHEGVDAPTEIRSMKITEALQHLINCLNITYSPDKFNHD